MSAENLIHRLLPHQGCTITRTTEGVEIAGSAMNWVMSAGVVPFACRAPFIFRIVGRTDTTNLRMHWHRGELIFNWECNRARVAGARSGHGEAARPRGQGVHHHQRVARDRLGDLAHPHAGRCRWRGPLRVRRRLFRRRVSAVRWPLLRQPCGCAGILDCSSQLTTTAPTISRPEAAEPAQARP